jgi:hypothetical protein
MDNNILYIQLQGTLEQRNFVSEREDSGDKHFTYVVAKNTDDFTQMRQLMALLGEEIMDIVHIEESVVRELADTTLMYLVRYHSYV